MLDGRPGYLGAPPAGSNHGESLFQRLMWHPFVRPKTAHTFLPAIVPTTRACCGPPQISVQTAPGGTGERSFAPPAARRAHARAGCGSVPPAGAHLSVQNASGSPVAGPCSQKAIRSEVVAAVPAWSEALAVRATAVSAMRTTPRMDLG